jgi:hypothetical protein
MLKSKRLTGETGTGGVRASSAVVTAAAAMLPASACFAGLGLVWRGWMSRRWSAIGRCGCVCHRYVYD